MNDDAVDLGPALESLRCVRRKPSSAMWHARRTDTGEEVAVRIGAEPVGALGLPLEALGPAIWGSDAVVEPIAHERAVLERLWSVAGVPELCEPDVLPARAVACRWIDGLTSLASEVPLSPERLMTVAPKAFAVLEKVHAAGVLHRDLTPTNVVLRSEHEVVILDWELAAIGRRRAVGPIGTRGFVAPEVLALRFAPNGHVTAAADVFGMAATLFYARTGRRPFGGSPMAIVRGADLDIAGLTRAEAEIFRWLLARHPDRRCGDATSARRAWEDLGESPTPAGERVVRRVRSSSRRLESALDAIDAGALCSAADELDALGAASQADAALGYAYLAWRLGVHEIAATLIMVAGDHGRLAEALRWALGPAGDAIPRMAWSSERAKLVVARAAFQRGDWLAALTRLDMGAAQPATREVLKERLDVLTRPPFDEESRREVVVLASLLWTPAACDQALYELARRAYPGPGKDPTRVSDHAYLVAAADHFPGHAGAVGSHLVAVGAYPRHAAAGLPIRALTNVDDAVCASLVELGCRARALERAADADWSLRARVLILCGESAAARVCLEQVEGDARQTLAFYRLVMAQLIHSGRARVALNVHERACATLSDGASEDLDALAAAARDAISR